MKRSKTKAIAKHEDWERLLVDDCRAIVTEGVFSSRWALIEAYHQLGARILEDWDKLERSAAYGRRIVQRLAASIDTSPRTVWYAVQFARKFPDIQRVPDGKNASWSKITRQHLPQYGGEDCEHAETETVTQERCVKCHKIVEQTKVEGKKYKKS